MVINVESLGRRFGDVWALKEINFQVQAGEFIGILGRNGAGKTTLVRLLTGQLSPSEGSMDICKHRVESRPTALRRIMGVMPDTTALFDGLTGEQYLHFVGRIHGLQEEVLQNRIRELGELLEIDFLQPLPIVDFSFGMKKKTALSAALLHAPSLLFLDEPFEGLDPVSSDTLRSLLESLRDHGTTILMTSHLLGLAERLCSRFIIINQGRIEADGSAESLLRGNETLESLFLRTVGKAKAGALTWM
ncbi:ABC transporter ATP-binding protein [Mesoterricola sediminis]|uniref:ABC transporter ATP-binding protein n=1 Tax=Mesoterricola sediminis TaxID=2927980 RepID=A0AA48GR98_9BACT|nr:ABC transporter ATP-binding protein [Mesoterricola sediminis]BDU77801.1 ABC transporter ATP-binding protein [Mesoterricola sediminis]